MDVKTAQTFAVQIVYSDGQEVIISNPHQIGEEALLPNKLKQIVKDFFLDLEEYH